MLSVIICTWSRSDSLRQTLESLQRMEVPATLQWELLVVDNNSTDDTSQVIDEFTERLPLKKLFEPRAGKSHALNLAVKSASGQHFIFTDDDVLVSTQWLCAYAAGFQQYSDMSLFGGPIEPRFMGKQVPRWLLSGFSVVANAFAIIDPQDAQGEITRDNYPYGANMAAHRRVFASHTYPVEIGPRPGSEIRGEEMVLIWNVLAGGGSGVWVPEATVEHCIPQKRQTLAYLRAYYLASGQLHQLTDQSDDPMLFGRPRWTLRASVQSWLLYCLTRYTRSPTVWLTHFRRAYVSLGMLKGYPASGQ